MLQDNRSIAFAGAVCAVNPEGAALVLVLKFQGITDFLYGALHVLVDNVLLPHIWMIGFGLNTHHRFVVRAQLNV